MCILSFGLSLITALALSPAAVNAQVGISQVAVIDFQNSSKMPGQMFGRMATDAVVLELIRSGKFGVIPSDSLEATMKQLGYDANMNQSAMVRLGQEAEASAVVSGEVLSIKVDKDKKVAEARIAVRLLDVASGEIVNGAYATGVSQPRVGYTADEDKMLVEAIKDAARSAVETMVAYIIPEATVLNCVGTSEVLLNKGSQEGIEPGMEMIVLRRMDGGREEVVGRIKISKVSDSDSMGSIIKAPRGVKPEDRVRAVYKMGDYSSSDRVAAPKKSNRKSLTNGSKLLWGLVALVGVAALFGNGGSKSETVPGAVAMAGASPDVTARWDDGGILLAWNPPSGVATDDILEYHVYMDNYFNASTGGNGNGNVGVSLAVGRAVAGPITTTAGKFKHHAVIDTGIWSPISWYYPNENHELEEGSSDPMPGINVGQTHKFWISAVYRRLNRNTGEYTWWETALTYAGQATYVTRPSCVEPTTDVPLTTSPVTFTWTPSTSADLYRIEISTDPYFARNKTFCKDIDLINAPMNSCTITPAEIKRDAEFMSALNQNMSNGNTTVYWRVGARKRTDTPGPYPAGTGSSAAADGPKHTRFIYCNQAMLFGVDQAPEPPGGGGGNGGDGDGDGTPPPPPGF